MALDREVGLGVRVKMSALPKALKSVCEGKVKLRFDYGEGAG